MKIIAGEHRGRVLRTPPGLGTRPMLARVREAMFDTLAGHVPRASVLDLFAGSGSLGLEALSRGAKRARLVEKDPRVQRVLSQNVEALGLEERVELSTADALSRAAWRNPDPDEGEAWVDILFFDPPYPWLRDEHRTGLLESLGHVMHSALNVDGIAVFHAPVRELREIDFPAGLVSAERTYGSSSLWYLQRDDEPSVEGAE